MNKTKKNKKGGDSDQKKKGNFILYNSIDKEAVCAICQEPLKEPKQIIEKGNIYQLPCGHQFHNNCLLRWCNINIERVDSNRDIERPAVFKCPVCSQPTLNEHEECQSLISYTDGSLSKKEQKQFASEEYTGKNPEINPEIKPEKKGIFDRLKKGMFSRFSKGGKTKKNKSKKNKTKKSYCYTLSKKITDGHVKVSNLHSIYYSCYGNKNGIPLLVVHGGPGGMVTKKHSQLYNPKKYFIVLVDQRGCGKSLPFGELRENNTDELVKDFEKIRKHLNIKKWILCGGSWGSTLALVYAIRHPSAIRKLFVSGVFLGNNLEIESLQGGNEKLGAKAFFPKAYDEYESFIPKKERGNLLKAYMRRFQGKLGKTVKNKAHMKWSLWERTINSVTEKSKKTMKKRLKLNNVYKTLSIIECHYFLNNCFLPENYILKNTHKIKHIPTYIIQGHFDLVCYPINAYMLHKALPKSKLFFTNGGHSLIDKVNMKTSYEVLKKFG